MEEPRDDDATKRIDEAFSRGEDGKPNAERDRPVMDEPESQPDMDEEAKEGGRTEPLGGNEPEEKEPSLEEEEPESKP